MREPCRRELRDKWWRAASYATRAPTVVCTGFWAAATSRTVKVVPRPGSLRTSMRPPCSTMICCVSASPRPVPPSFVEKNGSKILAQVLGRRCPGRCRRCVSSTKRLFDDGGGERQPAAAAHRLDGVAHEVEQRLAQLVLVGGHRRQRRPSRASTATPRASSSWRMNASSDFTMLAEILALEPRPRQAREAQILLGDLGEAIDLFDDRARQLRASRSAPAALECRAPPRASRR